VLQPDPPWESAVKMRFVPAILAPSFSNTTHLVSKLK
jgi:hypothetical protein